MTISKYSVLILHAVMLASLLASSHGVLKWVSVQPGGSFFELVLRQWPAVVLALAVYGLVFFYYIFVLRGSPVSILYPVYTGLSVVLVSLIGRVIFNESLSLTQIMGIGFILAGIALMSATGRA